MDPKDTSTSNGVNEDALQDMTVGSTGDLEKVVISVNENMPKPPESVMDVSPPPQDDVIAAPAAVEPVPEEAPVSDGAVSANPAEPVAPMPQEQVILPTGADPVSPAMNHEVKKTGKGLVVAIAVVLALVLASIALLVFMKANKTAKSSDNSAATPATSQKTTEAPKAAAPITASDVDAVTSDVDATLSTLDENKDFSADSLSDKTLGLQ